MLYGSLYSNSNCKASVEGKGGEQRYARRGNTEEKRENKRGMVDFLVKWVI